MRRQWTHVRVLITHQSMRVHPKPYLSDNRSLANVTRSTLLRSYLLMSFDNGDRGPHWSLKRAPTKRSCPNPTGVEVHEWVQPSHCYQYEQLLRHGHLLRWMDVAACLSGEMSWVCALHCSRNPILSVSVTGHSLQFPAYHSSSTKCM